MNDVSGGGGGDVGDGGDPVEGVSLAWGGGEWYERTVVYDMWILYRNKSTLNNLICTKSRNISLYDYTMLRIDWG